MRCMQGVRRSTTALLLGALLAGCGGTGGAETTPQAPLPPTLRPAALPGIGHSDRRLDLGTIAGEAPQSADLARLLDQWQFVAGAQREFRGGASKDMVDVVSRTLVFRDAAGARAFVQFVRRNPSTYIGTVQVARPVADHGRQGYVLAARNCGCHRETPLILYVASSGGRVTWLMANGPKMTLRSTRALGERAP
jgi:hypothetical protein